MKKQVSCLIVTVCIVLLGGQSAFAETANTSLYRKAFEACLASNQCAGAITSLYEVKQCKTDSDCVVASWEQCQCAQNHAVNTHYAGIFPTGGISSVKYPCERTCDPKLRPPVPTGARCENNFCVLNK